MSETGWTRCKSEHGYLCAVKTAGRYDVRVVSWPAKHGNYLAEMYRGLPRLVALRFDRYRDAKAYLEARLTEVGA